MSVSVGIAGLALVLSIVSFAREAKLSSRMAKIEEDRRREEVENASRAQLETSVVYDGESLFFRVENYGEGTATDIKLMASGPSGWGYESAMLPAVMPPGARWYSVLPGLSRKALARHGPERLINAVVTWEDDFSKRDGRAAQERIGAPVPRY